MLLKGIQVSAFLPYFLHSLGVIIFTLILYHIRLVLKFADKANITFIKSLSVFFSLCILTCGKHKFKLKLRSAGMRIDNFLLTNCMVSKIYIYVVLYLGVRHFYNF